VHCSESQTAIFFFSANTKFASEIMMKSNLDQERCKELEFEIPRPRVSQHHTMLEITGYQLAI